MSAATRGDPRASTPRASSTTSWRCPTTCATRSGASSRPGSASSEASGLVVCGMGGSGSAAALAAAALGDRLSKPLLVVRDYELAPWTPPDHAVLCISYSGNTEETLACFAAAEALGGPADRRHHRRRPRRRGARRRRAGRSGSRPGSSRGPRSATCSRSPPRWRRAIGVAAASSNRDRRRRRSLEDERDALVERAAELADQLEGTTPVIYGCRPHRARRLPLEDAGEREREAARLHPRAPRDGPQRDRRLGGRSRGGPLQRDLPHGLRPAPAPAPAGGADRGAGRARRRARDHDRDRAARREPTGCCGGDARRPRLAPPRRPPRRRPLAGRR